MNVHVDKLISKIEEEGGGVGVSRSSAKVSSSISMCSSDLTEDASSSSTEPFDDLSDLISQLPIIHVKKGLSKYYKGKSQSFTSLANVTSLKDLMKRGARIKSCCKRDHLYGPKATTSMKATTTSSSHSPSSLTFTPFHDSPKSVQ